MAFPIGWTRKCKITIPDAQISGDNTDFPLLITQASLPIEMLDGGGNSALNGGGDVRFSEDSAGTTRLALELVTFVTGGAAEAEIWVKLPTLNTGAVKEFYVWYKKAGELQPVATAPYGRNAVWANTEVGSHFQDSSGIDFSGNGRDFGSNGSVVFTPFGKGRSLPVAADGASQIVSTFTFSGFTAFTVSIRILTRERNNYNPKLGDDWGKFVMHASEGGTVYVGIGVGDRIVTAAGVWKEDVWQTHTYEWDGTTGRYIVDGVGVGSHTPAAPSSFAKFGIFGGGAWPYVDADIEYIQLENVSRGVDWALTRHNNESDPASFSSAGTPEAVGGGAVLGLQDATHALASGLIIFSQDHSVNSAETRHNMASDAVVIGLGQSVTLQDAAHGVASDVVILSQTQALVLSGGFHNLTDDSVVLSQGYGLGIEAGKQRVTSDDVSLAQLQALFLHNATHGLSSDQTVMIDPAAFIPNPGRTVKADRQSRILTPRTGARTTYPTNI